MFQHLDWIKLPQFRLPKRVQQSKRNDAVVFNYPAELEYPLVKEDIISKMRSYS
jgi:signal peptidase I